jgi:hypothetical protein
MKMFSFSFDDENFLFEACEFEKLIKKIIQINKQQRENHNFEAFFSFRNM